MLAIRAKQCAKYGCPNCGCDYNFADSMYRSDQPGITCGHCGLHYQILGEKSTPSVKFNTGRVDANGKEIMEYATLLEKHPRFGTPKWHWEAPDEKPDEGEYFTPRHIGYDLAGFIKSKKSGERLLGMVKETLHKDEVESWLDFRDSEPNYIQFKFQKSEFNLEELSRLVRANNKIITRAILEKCKIQ